jgi:hypothetical protein
MRNKPKADTPSFNFDVLHVRSGSDTSVGDIQLRRWWSYVVEGVERTQPGAILVHNPAIAEHNTSALLLATEVYSPFCYA